MTTASELKSWVVELAGVELVLALKEYQLDCQVADCHHELQVEVSNNRFSDEQGGPTSTTNGNVFEHGVFIALG